MTLERLTQITSVGITSGITLNSATLTGVTTLTTASASGNVSAVDGTFSGDLNVAGTLTYEDVSNIDSVGVITARSGLHVTGGSVGIGTDNPAEKLEVYGNVRFKDPDGSHGIEFYPDVAGLGYQRIISYNRTSSAYESLSIGVDNFIVTQGSSTERLRINSSGNVGIGTNTPGTIESWSPSGTYLHVGGTTASGVIMKSNYPRLVWNEMDQGANSAIFQINMSEGQTQFQHINDDGSIKAERLRISSDGNIGINRTNPSEKLEIFGGDLLISNDLTDGNSNNCQIKFEYN